MVNIRHRRTVFIRLLSIGAIATAYLGCASQQIPIADDTVLLIDDGEQYLKQGNYRDAIAHYREELKSNPDDVYLHNNLGIALVRVSEYKDALRHLNYAVRKLSGDFDTRLFLAEALRGLEKHADAIVQYKKALELRPQAERAHRALAWSLVQIGHLSEALVSISDYRKQHPEDGQAAIIHVRILNQLGRIDQAQAIIRSAKSIANPYYLPFFQSLEAEIHLQKDDHILAAKLFREALKAQPLMPTALIGLGKCYLLEGKEELAIDYIKRALRMQPKLDEGYMLLSLAYSAKAPKVSAKYQRKFKRIAGEDPRRLKQLKELGRQISQRLNHANQNNLPIEESQQSLQ